MKSERISTLLDSTVNEKKNSLIKAEFCMRVDQVCTNTWAIWKGFGLYTCYWFTSIPVVWVGVIVLVLFNHNLIYLTRNQLWWGLNEQNYNQDDLWIWCTCVWWSCDHLNVYFFYALVYITGSNGLRFPMRWTSKRPGTKHNVLPFGFNKYAFLIMFIYCFVMSIFHCRFYWTSCLQTFMQ